MTVSEAAQVDIPVSHRAARAVALRSPSLQVARVVRLGRGRFNDSLDVWVFPLVMRVPVEPDVDETGYANASVGSILIDASRGTIVEATSTTEVRLRVDAYLDELRETGSVRL